MRGAEDPDGARIRVAEIEHALDESRLARAVDSHQPEKLAASHLEREIAQRGDAGVTLLDPGKTQCEVVHVSGLNYLKAARVTMPGSCGNRARRRILSPPRGPSEFVARLLELTAFPPPPADGKPRRNQGRQFLVRRPADHQGH